MLASAVRPFIRPSFPHPPMRTPVARPRAPQPLKHTRYPLGSPKEIESMTVCIAGICLDEEFPRILFCADRRIGTEFAGGDVCLKWDHAGDGWMAMLAGTVSKARSLAGACRKISFRSIPSLRAAPPAGAAPAQCLF